MRQPSWLTGITAGKPTCSECGVTLESSGSFGQNRGEIPILGDINADHAGFSTELAGRADLQAKMSRASGASERWVYSDAKGNRIESMIELGCPVFMLDHKGVTMENKERLRRVDDRVDGVEDRVDGVETVVESVEDRVARLEAENADLRARMDAAQVDVTAVINWLAEMVALHAKQKMETVVVEVPGRGQAALPPPVADLIFDIGKVPEPATLDAEYVEPARKRRRRR